MHYRLDWIRDGMEPAGDSSWQTTTDLGYRVRVTRGYISSYSMELVECPRDATPLAALPRAPWWSLLEGVAYAGHAVGTPNPAAIRAMQVESLLAPTARDAGHVTLAPQTYCQFHYLVARAAREAEGLPTDLDMVDTTVHIEGTYRRANDTSDVPFVIHSAAANGALLSHAADSPAPLHVDSGVADAVVTVRRRPARMFDGVDFAAMKPPVIAGQILKSLVANVDVVIAVAHGDA